MFKLPIALKLSADYSLPTTERDNSSSELS